MSMGGGSGGGTSSNTTVQKADPWSGVIPYLQGGDGITGLFPAANQNMQSGGPQYFPGDTVAQPGLPTDAANAMAFVRGASGSPVTETAKNQVYDTNQGSYLYSNPLMGLLQNTANGSQAEAQHNVGMSLLGNTATGGMLNNNPYIDSMFNTAAGQVSDQYKNAVAPGIASMYAGGGRYGSNSMNQAMDTAQTNYGNTIGNLATSMYGQNYATERGMQQQAIGMLGTNYDTAAQRQLQASGLIGANFDAERARQMQSVGMSNGIANQDYTDINAMAGAGANQDQANQNNLNALIQRWNFNQQQPMQNLQNYSNILQGFGGGSSTANSTGTVPTQQKSPLAGALGGAQLASSLGGAIGGSSAAMGALGEGGAMAAGGMMTGGWGLAAGALLGALFS